MSYWTSLVCGWVGGWVGGWVTLAWGMYSTPLMATMTESCIEWVGGWVRFFLCVCADNRGGTRDSFVHVEGQREIPPTHPPLPVRLGHAWVSGWVGGWLTLRERKSQYPPMIKKRVPANQYTRNKSLGAISPYRVTNTREKKDGEEEEEEEEEEAAPAPPLKGIFCQSPFTDACVCRVQSNALALANPPTHPPRKTGQSTHPPTHPPHPCFHERPSSLLTHPPTHPPAPPRRLGQPRPPGFWSRPWAWGEGTPFCC